MLIGKLVLGMPNVMLLDEPTNHLDMESIESLNTALDRYTGTLVFVSHDREFVSSLATRIIELRPRREAGRPGDGGGLHRKLRGLPRGVGAEMATA